MSNTDGEDTQRKTVEEILQGCLQGLSVRIPHILIRYVHIAMQTYADQELASLREQLKQKEDENRELKASIAVLLDELMYESTNGDFWMWARSNEKVPDRIMKIRNDNLSA